MLLVIGCIIYTSVHVVQSDSERVRGLPKSVWLVLVLCLPVVGMVAWWIFGRPINTAPPPSVAPDDDPDFLRRL